MNYDVKRAVKLGSMCSVAYFAVYIARNLLGVLTPDMVNSGKYTVEFIGAISTGYMLCYAFGQLINGAIGDKIKGRYMIAIGNVMAGVCSFFIPFFTSKTYIALLYSLSGYFLSMIYGPMTKIISENVIPKFASRCALGYTFASFIATPSAGLLAILFNWKTAFKVCAVILIFMGLFCNSAFYIFEKKKDIQYGKYKLEDKTNKKGIKLLLENEIVKYSFISILTGIVRTTVVFWIPTFLTQYLHYSSKIAVVLFTCITVCISMAPYLNNLLMYEKVFKRDRNKTVVFMFALSSFSFLMLFLFKNPIVSVLFLILAVISNGGVATMLYSVYCPSLRDTGMVSSATGFVDFLSYMGAALSNLIFSNAVEKIGWAWLIIIWSSLMFVGVLISLPQKKKAKKQNV